MNTLVPTLDTSQNLPRMIERAANALAGATTAAEVLEARNMANFAYDAAKAAVRLAKAKQAHDDVIGAVYRAQADAAEIEALAKRRLADEYDAAQERGEVQKHGGQGKRDVPDQNIPSAADLGLSRKDIYEARIIRDAEANEPGVVRRTLDQRIEQGKEPSKASLREAVVAAAMRGLRGGGARRDKRNPIYKPNPQFGVVASLSGCCRTIIEHLEAHSAEYICGGFFDDAMRERNIKTMTDCVQLLSKFLEEANAR